MEICTCYITISKLHYTYAMIQEANLDDISARLQSIQHVRVTKRLTNQNNIWPTLYYQSLLEPDLKLLGTLSYPLPGRILMTTRPTYP